MRRLCCAKLSGDGKLLSGGFEDSTLRVWSLTPRTLYADHADVNVARINMACDTLEDIQEKQKLVLRIAASATFVTTTKCTRKTSSELSKVNQQIIQSIQNMTCCSNSRLCLHHVTAHAYLPADRTRTRRW